MIQEKKTIFTLNFYLLILGFVLILFASVFIFTREALWEGFKLSGTGQIGDTIGGITAPVINLIGAILVYISFKAQINANKLQFDLLNNEIQNQRQRDNFNITLELFKELKEDYKNLSYSGFLGQSALNAFVNEIKDNWTKDDFIRHTKKSIYYDWKYILCEYDLILTHIDTVDFRSDEKNKIYKLILNYYIIQLEYSVENIKPEFIKHKVEDDVLRIIYNFDNKKTIIRL